MVELERDWGVSSLGLPCNGLGCVSPQKFRLRSYDSYNFSCEWTQVIFSLEVISNDCPQSGIDQRKAVFMVTNRGESTEIESFEEAASLRNILPGPEKQGWASIQAVEWGVDAVSSFLYCLLTILTWDWSWRAPWHWGGLLCIHLAW